MAVSENPKAKLTRGESLEGTVGFWKKKKWELSKAGLKIDDQPAIPLNQITHVHCFNKIYKVYAEGVEPIVELPTSKEVRAMSRALTKYVEKRKSKGANLDNQATSGRLLTAALIWNWGAFLLAGILFLGFALFMTGIGVLELQRQRFGLPGFAGVAVLYAITASLFWLARIKGPRLECFENEVQHVGLLGNRTVLDYDDIVSLSTGVTEVIGDNPKTKTKLTLEGTQETIHFSDPRGFARRELAALESLIAERLTREFWQTIELGKTVPFGKSRQLSKQGLIYQDGSVIPYSEMSEIRLKDGVAQFFRSGEKKPFLKIKSKENNFFPCYNLLVLLSESKMTYMEYCGSEVKPIFGE
ncbi:MAG: hypothetical protein ACI87E_000771 [Mariniblastus sp.]|jgi:hypothetical protein